MFGRTKEEPSPQARLAGTQQQVGGAAPVDIGGGARGGGGKGPHEGLLLLLFTVLTLAASAWLLASEERHAVNDPAEKAARGEINGLGDLSLLREANLQRILDDVAESKRPLVMNLRVAPDRASLTVRDSDGSRKVRTVDPAFDADENDFGVGEDDALRPEQINAAAPERMAREIAKLTGLGLDAIDYATISSSSSGPPTWYMALDEGPARVRQWVAAADGSDIRKPGEPSREQKAETRRDEAERRRIARVYEQRSKCFRTANSPEAISRCTEKYSP